MDNNCTPTRVRQPAMMSNSLKERLKRCGRYHAGSPGMVLQTSLTLSPADADSSFVPVAKTSKLTSTSLGTPERSANLQGDEAVSDSVKANGFTKADKNAFSLKRKKLVRPPNEDKSEISSPEHNCEMRKTHCISNDQQKSFNCSNEGNYHEREDLIKSCPTVINGSLASSKTVFEGTTKSISTASHPNLSPSECENRDHLSSQLQSLDLELKAKLELLRKLRMVKMYREKNDLTELQQLIDRWRCVSQSVLSDLHSLSPEPRPSMAELISHLQIDPNLVKYDVEEQEFNQ